MPVEKGQDNGPIHHTKKTNIFFTDFQPYFYLATYRDIVWKTAGVVADALCVSGRQMKNGIPNDGGKVNMLYLHLLPTQKFYKARWTSAKFPFKYNLKNSQNVSTCFTML